MADKKMHTNNIQQASIRTGRIGATRIGMKTGLRIIALATIVLSLWTSTAHANVNLRRHADMLPIQIQNAVDTTKPLADRTFNLLVSEDVTYHNTVLPKGSILCGTVTRMRPSKRLGRPAFIKISFHQVILPDQTILTMEPSGRHSKPDMIIQPNKDKTFTHFVLENVLLENASLLVTGPLAMSEHLSVAMFNLVDTSVGAAMGAGYGKIQSHRNAVDKADTTPQNQIITSAPLTTSVPPVKADGAISTTSTSNSNFQAKAEVSATQSTASAPLETKQHQARNVIGGIYESISPIPPFWVLATKAPNIHYQPGDNIRVSLTSSGLHHIMPMLSAYKPSSIPLQPVALAPTK